jgi:hypothetical protein
MGANSSAADAKIAFILDDRLPHDRKTIFARTVSVLKNKFLVEVMPATMTEDELLAHLQANPYSLVMLPWYKYLLWKKIEGFFGSLRLQGPTVAGYFADAVLPFEFSGAPNYHRTILLDLYRMEQTEIELMVQSLVYDDKRTGLSGFQNRHSIIYQGEWFHGDHNSTRCVDSALKIPLLQNGTWTSRQAALRFYMTALWMLCFHEKRSFPDTSACATLELGELNKHLLIRLNFDSNELTLKRMMEYLWPSGAKENLPVNEMVKHSDFLRIHHYPENHHIEITAFFSHDAPSLNHPGEVRGFWIEPLKKKYIRTTEEEFLKCIPIQHDQSMKMGENLHVAIESIRKTLLQASSVGQSEIRALDPQIINLRFLMNEIDKRFTTGKTEKRITSDKTDKKKIA